MKLQKSRYGLLFCVLCMPIGMIQAMEVSTGKQEVPVVSTASNNNNSAVVTLNFADDQQLELNQKDFDLLRKKSSLIMHLMEDNKQVQSIPLACKKSDFEVIWKLLQNGIYKQIIVERRITDVEMLTAVRLADFFGIKMPFKYISDWAFENASREDRNRYLDAWREHVGRIYKKPIKKDVPLVWAMGKCDDETRYFSPHMRKDGVVYSPSWGSKDPHYYCLDPKKDSECTLHKLNGYFIDGTDGFYIACPGDSSYEWVVCDATDIQKPQELYRAEFTKKLNNPYFVKIKTEYAGFCDVIFCKDKLNYEFAFSKERQRSPIQATPTGCDIPVRWIQFDDLWCKLKWHSLYKIPAIIGYSDKKDEIDFASFNTAISNDKLRIACICAVEKKSGDRCRVRIYDREAQSFQEFLLNENIHSAAGFNPYCYFDTDNVLHVGPLEKGEEYIFEPVRSTTGMSYEDMSSLCNKAYNSRPEGFMRPLYLRNDDVSRIVDLRAGLKDYLKRRFCYGLIGGISLVAACKALSYGGYQTAATIAKDISWAIAGYASAKVFNRYWRKQSFITRLQNQIESLPSFYASQN